MLRIVPQVRPAGSPGASGLGLRRLLCQRGQRVHDVSWSDFPDLPEDRVLVTEATNQVDTGQVVARAGVGAVHHMVEGARRSRLERPEHGLGRNQERQTHGWNEMTLRLDDLQDVILAKGGFFGAYKGMYRLDHDQLAAKAGSRITFRWQRTGDAMSRSTELSVKGRLVALAALLLASLTLFAGVPRRRSLSRATSRPAANAISAAGGAMVSSGTSSALEQSGRQHGAVQRLPARRLPRRSDPHPVQRCRPGRGYGTAKRYGIDSRGPCWPEVVSWWPYQWSGAARRRPSGTSGGRTRSMRASRARQPASRSSISSAEQLAGEPAGARAHLRRRSPSASRWARWSPSSTRSERAMRPGGPLRRASVHRAAFYRCWRLSAPTVVILEGLQRTARVVRRARNAKSAESRALLLVYHPSGYRGRDKGRNQLGAAQLIPESGPPSRRPRQPEPSLERLSHRLPGSRREPGRPACAQCRAAVPSVARNLSLGRSERPLLIREERLGLP